MPTVVASSHAHIPCGQTIPIGRSSTPRPFPSIMDIFYASSGSHHGPSVSRVQVGAGAQHPGDYADAQRILDWEKALRAEIKASNLAEVLASRAPAAIKRGATGPVLVDEFYLEYTTDDYTAVHKSARRSERKKHRHDNEAKRWLSARASCAPSTTASTRLSTFGCGGIRRPTR